MPSEAASSISARMAGTRSESIAVRWIQKGERRIVGREVVEARRKPAQAPIEAPDAEELGLLPYPVALVARVRANGRFPGVEVV